jgi:hypothetical protein
MLFSLTGVNDGQEIKQFASDIISNWDDGTAPSYDSQDGVGHFRSYINALSLLSDIEDAVQLNGSDALNNEARQFAPQYSEAMYAAMTADPTEDVLVLAHSQGTNNLVFSLRMLFDTHPDFFAERNVRCAMFDPKVGANHVQEIVVMDPDQKIQFLFFQSQNDILGNQAFFVQKFIDQFQHGNHIWVRGQDHQSIHEWKTYSTVQSWLNLEEYIQFRRDCSKELIFLQQDFGKPGLNTVYLGKFQKYVRDYEMNEDQLSAALLGFLEGALPKKFQS